MGDTTADMLKEAYAEITRLEGECRELMEKYIELLGTDFHAKEVVYLEETYWKLWVHRMVELYAMVNKGTMYLVIAQGLHITELKKRICVINDRIAEYMNNA